jgi:peroxiredoxin
VGKDGDLNAAKGALTMHQAALIITVFGHRICRKEQTMAAETPICNFGEPARPFELPATDGKRYSLDDVRGPNGLLVMFICNHCPYVKSVLDRIIRDVKDLEASGIGAVAIMSNDTVNYPDDSFPNMKTLAEAKDLPFPYLFDETQEVARAYDAVCTPDFFGYNADLELQYRGRLDASKTTPIPNAVRELYDAMVQVAETGRGPEHQISSMGCSIKWKAA